MAFIALTGVYNNRQAVNNTEITDMIRGFQVGIFIGLQTIMILYIVKYRKALNNQDELRKIYIEENDERTKLIKDKIGGVGFNFSLGMIATATIISGFFNQVVFVTLCAALFFVRIYVSPKFIKRNLTSCCNEPYGTSTQLVIWVNVILLF